MLSFSMYLLKMCLLFTYTISISVICVSWKELSFTECNQQTCDFYNWVIFEIKFRKKEDRQNRGILHKIGGVSIRCTPFPPYLYEGGIDPPKNCRKGVDWKFWVKRGWSVRRGDHFEREDQSQKVKFLK